VAQRVPRS